MRKALIFDNKVIQVEDSIFPVSEPMIWIDCPDDCKYGWIYDPQSGTVSTPPIPPESTAEKLAKYKTYTHDRLYEEALNKNYDSELHIMSYATSANATYKADATQYSGWRDSVKSYSDPVYQDIINETGTEPSFDEFKLSFPVYPS